MITWENEVVNLIQSKTKETLSFPMNVYSSNELFDYLIVKKSTTKLEGPIPRQQKPINRPLGTVAGILSKIFNQKEIGGLYPLSLSHTHRTNASVIDLGKPYTQKGTPIDTVLFLYGIFVLFS